MASPLTRLVLITALVSLCLPPLRAADLSVARRERLAVGAWRGAERDWVRDHVGVIFYADGPEPRFSMEELTAMSRALGVQHVKTWLKGSRPGEMREKLATPDYVRILDAFGTVLFDVCPDFMLQGPYDDAKARTIREEYAGVAEALATAYRGRPRTFLLSLFMETNLFFGTERAHFPDFPAERFFEDATAGVHEGIARARRAPGAGDLPRIHTVIEVANLPRDFIRRFLPRTRADLYAISYYGRGELGQPDVTLRECVKAVAESAPTDGPFGRNNIILGELGRSVFAGGNDGEDREQLDYLRKTLATARRARMPYAFVFWLADQERSPDDGWGLASSKPAGGRLRRAWHAFQGAFSGAMPAGRETRPQPAIDAIRPARYNAAAGRTVRVEVDVANRSTWAQAAAPVRGLRVRLAAGDVSREAVLDLAPDEVATLRADVPAPADAELTVTAEAPGLPAVRKAASLARADLVVDRVYTEPAVPHPGEPTRLFAVVRNRGTRPITDFAVHFHVDDFRSLWVTWGCIYGETLLQPGQALPIGGGFLWNAVAGEHRIQAWANPDGGREASYRNNLGYGAVTVR